MEFEFNPRDIRRLEKATCCSWTHLQLRDCGRSPSVRIAMHWNSSKTGALFCHPVYFPQELWCCRSLMLFAKTSGSDKVSSPI
jgi:hypothetical protein